MTKLSAKQEQFCQEYMVDLNSTQAAIRAGYSEKAARQIGAENMAKPYIAEKIEQLRKQAQQETKVSADSIIKELAKGAFADLDVADMKYSDKLKCLELLSKHLGLLDGQGAGKSDKGDVQGRLLQVIGRIGIGRSGAGE